MGHQTELLIESYFAGTLSEAEKQELKTLLASDPEAAESFAFQQKLADQARKGRKLSVAESIQNKDWQEAARPPFRTIKTNRFLWAAAAAVALLLLANILMPSAISNLAGTNKPRDLVAESFEHFPNKMKFKSLGENPETVSPDVIEAFGLYDQKKYREASWKLADVCALNPTRLDYRFYLGVCFMAEHNYSQAINMLLTVAKDSNSSYATPAKYYTGVAYAGIKDTARAKSWLQQYIDAPDGVEFKDKAEELLNSLK